MSRKSLSKKTLNKNKIRTYTPSAALEPTIPTIELPQTFALDRTFTEIVGFLLISALFLLRLFVTPVNQLTLRRYVRLFCQSVISFTLFTVNPITVLSFLIWYDIIHTITKAFFNKIRNYQCDVMETFVIADSSIRILYVLSRIQMEVLIFDQDF
jgi:hypothetical protein